MKKILFAAVAALAITGCSQNEEIEKAAQTTEIGFNAIVKNTTRAAVTNIKNLGNFKVHSYITGTTFDGSTELGTAYMNGVLFETKIIQLGPLLILKLIIGLRMRNQYSSLRILLR